MTTHNLLMSVLAIVMVSMSGCMTVALPSSQASSSKMLTSDQPFILNEQKLTGKLAFIVQRGRGRSQRNQLVVSELDGTKPEVLLDIQGTLSSLSASVDGRTLVFTRQQQHYPQIYTFDMTSRRASLITPQAANHFSAALSPDGQKLLLSSSLHDNPEIFLADRDGSQLKQLTHNPAADIAPTWSPDGQSFIFTSDRSGLYHPQLYRYDFGNHVIRRLPIQGNYNANAKISPDGQWLSYIHKTAQSDITRELYHLATGAKLIVANEGLAESMSFSPDSRFVVYSTGQAIVLANLPDAQSKPLDNHSVQSSHQWQLQPQYTIHIAGVDEGESVIIHEPVWLK